MKLSYNNKDENNFLAVNYEFSNSYYTVFRKILLYFSNF